MDDNSWRLGNLIIHGLSAFGTWGAVVYSLWTTFKKEDKVRVRIIADGWDGGVKTFFMNVEIENCQPFPLKIYKAYLNFEKRLILIHAHFEATVIDIDSIPPLSSVIVKFSFYKNHAVKTIEENRYMHFHLKTSSGKFRQCLKPFKGVFILEQLKLKIIKRTFRDKIKILFFTPFPKNFRKWQ